MALTPGTRVGPYEISSQLGAGGMGEVYRARDAKLHREVAIKVLPDLLAGDPERRARFEREAYALAALNHPNIAHIYGVEEGLDTLALVMELVEGPTLADRIAGAPKGLPVEDAIRIASQVAEALEAAHAAGIVHRDLKPANIKVRPDGVVKVLDFGLARMAGTDPLGSASAANSPTYASPAATAHGVILGTAAYMAPEQARGQIADARSDLWAFGVVLYEMLTGAPLFQGKTISDVLASVLRDAPRWDALPPETPPGVRRLLRRCLQRDPQLRFRNAGDARIELMADDDAAAPESVPVRPWRAALVGTLVGGVVVAAGLGAWAVAGRSTPDAPPLRKWTIARDGSFDSWRRWNVPAISPDGGRLAYTDGRKLLIRDLASLESVEIAVQDLPLMAVWAPDSSFVVFATERAEASALWRVAAAGGAPSKICDLPTWMFSGLAMQGDHTVVVNLSNGSFRGRLLRVDARGGVPQPMTGRTEDESSTAIVNLGGLPDGALTYQQLRGGAPEMVVEGPGKARATLGLPPHWRLSYAPSGHLLYDRRPGGIWAVPFDLATHTVTGEPFRITADGTAPTISSDGTLAYGRDVAGLRQLTWVGRDGTTQGTIGPPQEFISGLQLSPDGTRVAVGGFENGVGNIWVHDIARGTKSKLTSGGGDCCPVWHPSEPRLAFLRAQDWSLWSVNIDTGEETMIVAGGERPSYDPTWASDGTLLFGRFSTDTLGDIWMLPPGADTPVRFMSGPAQEQGKLSPDGRYLVYQTDESGVFEVFVREFPSGRGRRQVSIGGGRNGYWSPKGDEIFYVRDQQLMSARVRTQPTLQVDVPRPLFTFERPNAADQPAFDTRDGQRFVVVKTLKPAQSSVVVVQNWFEEFKRVR